MSVLQNIYPIDTQRLGVESLTTAFAKAVAGVTFEWEDAPRKKPNWSAVTIAHPRYPGVHSLFVAAKNSALNKRELNSRYKGNKNLNAVQKASSYIWSQLKLPKKLSDKSIVVALDTHLALIAALSQACRGVVDLPENERLYSTAGFQRYSRKNRQ